jgi:ATP-dependent helicase/nuclease subunit A
MKFTTAQNRAITANGNLVVTAGAGSGKTRVLVERYLRLLQDAYQSDPAAAPDASGILAITFTEKAAREMRERVRSTVEQRARASSGDAQHMWQWLRDAVESARIGTIHSFCATLLRDHPAETGLDPAFTVLEEARAALLLSDCIKTALRRALETPHAIFDEFSPNELHDMLFAMVRGGAEVRAALEGVPDTAEALLTQWQTRLEQVQTVVREELLHSRAWCDASTTLGHLAAPPDDAIGAQVGAVQAWLASLNTAAETTRPAPDFSPILALNLRGGSKKKWPSADDLAAAKQALKTLREAYKAHAPLLELVPDAAMEQRVARAVLDLAALYRAARTEFQKHKRRHDTLDFDDLLFYAHDLLLRHPHVCARWQAELHAILVDEFQDTDNEQRATLYALTGITSADAPTPGMPGLFIVGDGKQSIYRFRGADVSVFRTVERDILAAGGENVQLDTSFRTHPHLLGWINRVTRTLLSRDRELQPYEVPFEPLNAHRPAPDYTRCVELHLVSDTSEGEAGEHDGQSEQAPARLTAHERRSSEALRVAERIAALVAGKAGTLVYDRAAQQWRPPTYGDIALLFRASTAFEYYEQALRQAGIPYLTTAGRGYYGRKEVQDLIHLLSVLNDPLDELALVGVLRSPLFALDDAAIFRLRFANPHSLWDALMASSAPAPLAFARETLRHLYGLRGQRTVVELLREALATTGYMATISALQDGERRRVNMEKLLQAARHSGSVGLTDFKDYLDVLLRVEPREGEAPLEGSGSVRLMTVHAAKGLEFPVVILPDLTRAPRAPAAPWLARQSYGVALRLRGAVSDWQQSVSYHIALWEEQRMEQAERERLLYVAMTRAQDYLILSGVPLKKSGNDWLSSIVAALGYPWEEGGPPPGQHAEMEVWC